MQHSLAQRRIPMSMSPRSFPLPGRSARAMLPRWVLACAIAELLGIAVAAGWWIAMDRIDPEPATLAGRWLSLCLKSLAGAGEGLVLGGLQAMTLRLVYPRLSSTAWVIVTMTLAVGGWAAGSAIPIFHLVQGSGAAPPDPGLGQALGWGAMFGGLVGALFGAAQRLVLRRVARRSGRWIVANAIGWAMALPVIYLAASLDVAGQGMASALALAGAAGLMAGALIGAATGIALLGMPARSSSWSW